MSKLKFTFSTMSAGKTSRLIQQAYNYKERDIPILVLTSALDTRYDVDKVTSRIGLTMDAVMIPEDDTDLLMYYLGVVVQQNIKAVFVDECQFLSDEQIKILRKIVDECDIDVYCYGIRTDFETNLFSGSEALFRIANELELIPTICECGENAVVNARKTTSTEKIVIGGNDIYTNMCMKCYNKTKEK